MGECKNRSWAWLAALGVMVACACLPAVAAEPLKVGYFDLPPHTTAGLSAGQDAAAKDYFRRVAERMGVAEVEFSQYPLPRLLLMLEQGRLDLALILAKTPEREAKLVYPGTPLFSTASVLAVRSNNPLSAVCGTICNRRCEAACTRGQIDDPIAIDEVKKFLADREIYKDQRYIPKKEVTLEKPAKIAVISSGPAGLAAADQLNASIIARELGLADKQDINSSVSITKGLDDFYSDIKETKP